jgi:hypothetical protein
MAIVDVDDLRAEVLTEFKSLNAAAELVHDGLTHAEGGATRAVLAVGLVALRPLASHLD